MFVKKLNDVDRIEATEDGAQGAGLRWMLGPKDEMPNFYLRVVEIEIGGQSMHHQHDYEHEVFVLEGNGILVGEDQSLHLEPGSAGYVPPNVIHQFRNTGDTTMKFICVIPRVDG
jgi:quercetin dioxygenase-like cupin family protein